MVPGGRGSLWVKDYLNINGGKSAAFAPTPANGQTFPLSADKDEKP